MHLRNLPASIFGHDNDQYMVASCEEPLPGIPSKVFCAVCGWKKEWRFTRPDFALGSRKRDVSMTYVSCDGFPLTALSPQARLSATLRPFTSGRGSRTNGTRRTPSVGRPSSGPAWRHETDEIEPYAGSFVGSSNMRVLARPAEDTVSELHPAMNAGSGNSANLRRAHRGPIAVW